jgi:hypothetical protein
MKKESHHLSVFQIVVLNSKVLSLDKKCSVRGEIKINNPYNEYHCDVIETSISKPFTTGSFKTLN